MAGAAPRRPGTPTWALAPPRALPSGAQPRIHQKPCAPAASLRGRRPAPRLPLLAPAGAAPRAHTARPPPGFIHKDLLEASRTAQEAQPLAPQRAGGQASESHTPGSGTVPISNPASLLSGPRKGRLSREASASSPQHSRIAVLPGAAPRFFFFPTGLRPFLAGTASAPGWLVLTEVDSFLPRKSVPGPSPRSLHLKNTDNRSQVAAVSAHTLQRHSSCFSSTGSPS